MNIRKFYLKTLFLVFVIFNLIGCSSSKDIKASNKTDTKVYTKTEKHNYPVEDTWETERDHIGMLAAYSAVYRGWQENNARGYNIGSVLLNNKTKDGRLVFWGLNSNNITRNETQHGEVRLMIGYLSKLQKERLKNKSVPDIQTLKEHTIYTTLEPCAQCSGMMTLQNVFRTVYGQKDPGFGDALERLQLNSLPNGYEPYPRAVKSDRSDISYCTQLEEGYSKYKPNHENPHITDYLKSNEAKAIFASAYNEFMSFKPKHSENEGFYKDAKGLIKSVSKEFIPLNPAI